MLGTTIRLTAADGHSFSAYLVEPVPMPSGPKGAIVIVQEIFGVNGHIRTVCEDYAREGYRTLAPALFDRAAPGVELGYQPEDIQQGRALRGKVPDDKAVMDIAAAIAHLGGKAGVVGYCWGGTIAWLAATRLKPAAAVCYYGGGIAAAAAERPGCPVIMHFGEQDKGIPMTDVEKVRKAHPDMSVFTYPAGHGFNCTERGDFDAESAALAQARSLNFLEKYLR